VGLQQCGGAPAGGSSDRDGQTGKLKMIIKVVPTTGLEPIKRVFSPLPMIASFSVFIAHTVTSILNHFKH
jgi:hypothetical protein